MKNKKIKSTTCLITGLMAFSMTFGALNFNSQTQQTVYAGSLTDSSVSDENTKGDVNADGSFDIADVVLLQKWLLAAPDTELTNWKAADFCDDGRLNVFDLCLMRRALFAENPGVLKTQTIPVSENNAKLLGRTQKTDGITWLVHSGSAAEFTVTGTEASVTICGDSGINSEEKYRPRYGVYVDGELVKDVVMGEKEQTVELFSGTVSRTATVKIIHLSEANNGCIGVKALTKCIVNKDGTSPSHAAVIPSSFKRPKARHAVFLYGPNKSKHLRVKPERLYRVIIRLNAL